MSGPDDFEDTEDNEIECDGGFFDVEEDPIIDEDEDPDDRTDED